MKKASYFDSLPPRPTTGSAFSPSHQPILRYHGNMRSCLHLLHISHCPVSPLISPPMGLSSYYSAMAAAAGFPLHMKTAFPSLFPGNLGAVTQQTPIFPAISAANSFLPRPENGKPRSPPPASHPALSTNRNSFVAISEQPTNESEEKGRESPRSESAEVLTVEQDEGKRNGTNGAAKSPELEREKEKENGEKIEEKEPESKAENGNVGGKWDNEIILIASRHEMDLHIIIPLQKTERARGGRRPSPQKSPTLTSRTPR